MHKKLNQHKIPQSNWNIINLSKRQEEELIKYFLHAYEIDKACKHILIKYAKMFIGNKISYELCKKLCNITQYNDLFKVKLIRIKEDSYSIFYIDDFIRLVRVAGASEKSICIEHYNDIVNLNGYTLAYCIQKPIVIDSIVYPENGTEYHSVYLVGNYISFILYKDDVIYIVNNYIPNEKFETYIEHTYHSTIINGKKTVCDYEFEKPGLSKQQLKEYLDAILIINKLKDSE